MNYLEKLAASAMCRGLLDETKALLAEAQQQDGGNMPISNDPEIYQKLAVDITPLASMIFRLMGDPKAANLLDTALKGNARRIMNFDDSLTWNDISNVLKTMTDLAKYEPFNQDRSYLQTLRAFSLKFNTAISQHNRPETDMAMKKSPAKYVDPKRVEDKLNKIKQIQQAIGVPATGKWDGETNAKFLQFLKGKGWDKYISGDKFMGTLDDAVRTVLVENAPTGEAFESGKLPKDAIRKERLQKLADLLK